MGPIFGDFIRDLVDVNTKITNLIDAEKAGNPAAMNPKNKMRLWMLRQDLAAYILLGDPAAYLPLVRTAPRPARAEEETNSNEENGAS